MTDVYLLCFCFFFKQKTAYEMRISDWSSDVCSSDLLEEAAAQRRVHALVRQRAPAVADVVVVPHRQRRHPRHHPGHLRLAVELEVAAEQLAPHRRLDRGEVGPDVAGPGGQRPTDRKSVVEGEGV